MKNIDMIQYNSQKLKYFIFYFLWGVGRVY